MIPDEQRGRMVEEQLMQRGLRDERVLRAFGKVPRHQFVPPTHQHEAYADHPLPIGSGQTISQPYILAVMAAALGLRGSERVLEIGAGSGYLTAILAELVGEVYAIERLPELLAGTKARLGALGYRNVHLSHGNGSLGWPAHAPYDAILLSAAAPDVPQPLVEQLADPGRMVLPIGDSTSQLLVEIERTHGRLQRRNLTACVFVPLIGAHGWPPDATA